LHPPYYRGCWHGVSRCFFCRYHQAVFFKIRPFSLLKELYDPKAFITHAASLDQGFPHCPKFPTAASRGSLDRVSVPVWLIILSDQLSIVGLVGHYPTNYLMERSLILSRLTALPTKTAVSVRLFGISSGFPELSPAIGYISYVLLTRAPLYSGPKSLWRSTCMFEACR
jgi:hypothetical protein